MSEILQIEDVEVIRYNNADQVDIHIFYLENFAHGC